MQDYLLYLMLAGCCLLGGIRLIFNKLYVNAYGSALRSALWFTFLACGIFAVMMLAIDPLMEEHFSFTPFSFLMALIFAVINVACTVFGFATLAIGNVSTYTLVLQLGGMVLPFLYGVSLGGEDFVWQKPVSMLLIGVALFVNMERTREKKGSRRAWLYYGLLFALNGAACIVLTIHQTADQAATPIVGTSAFTVWYMNLTSVLALVALLVLRIKNGKLTPAPKRGPDIWLSAGYGVFYGFGNLLNAATLKGGLDSSIQFPIMTGVSVILAGIVGAIFFRERITSRFLIAIAIVLAGLAFIFPWHLVFG